MNHASNLPRPEFVALCEQSAKDGLCIKDVARHLGLHASSVRRRLERAERHDLIEVMAKHGRQRHNEHVDWTAGVARSTETAAQRREDRFEDIRFLLAIGESPEGISARLGLSLEAIARQARRWGQADIAGAFEPARWAERRRAQGGVAA